MKDYKEVITSTIKELGIPANLLGYHYIRYAVELMIYDISLINSITKVVYPMVAKKFNTTALRAERAIRHAIETGWDRANEDITMRLFGYSVSAHKGNPKNAEFIATVADYILMTYDHPTDKRRKIKK